LRLAGASELLAGLYDDADSTLDAEFLRAIGSIGSLDDADPADVLARLADGSRSVNRRQLRGLASWLSPQRVATPDRVRAVRDGDVVVVPSTEAVVVDAPDLIGLLGFRAVVPVPLSQAAALAERLGLQLASELASYKVRSAGVESDDAVLHDRLVVADADGADQEVMWRYVDATLHVDRRHVAIGLGRGRAWRDGVWAERHRRTEALIDPAAGRMREDEDDLDEIPHGELPWDETEE
jgi:hypothetical protein